MLPTMTRPWTGLLAIVVNVLVTGTVYAVIAKNKAVETTTVEEEEEPDLDMDDIQIFQVSYIRCERTPAAIDSKIPLSIYGGSQTLSGRDYVKSLTGYVLRRAMIKKYYWQLQECLEIFRLERGKRYGI